MSSVSFSICSFIYLIIFGVVYFTKNRINLVENKVYTCLLITTIIGLSIDIIGYFSFQYGVVDSIINILIAKVYLIYYFTWTLLLTVYTFIISTKSKKLDYNCFFKKILFMYVVLSIIILILKIQIQVTGSSLYSYGPSVNLVYLLSGVCVFIMFICIFSNVKNIKRKEYIPLLVFIVFGTIVMLVQHCYPELLLLITCHSIVTSLMYFTIENPDLQMVEELNKNRKLTEQNFEEKTNFLFKISQDLKKPLLDITELSNKIISNSSEEIKYQATIINNNSKQLYTYVNNALDISNMDINNLKIVKSIYNTGNFFEEIQLRIKTELKNQGKKIDFRYNISSDIPEFLNGDNTKLKQVILSVMFDSIKHTNEGFVELTINSIVKYGICRLMIDISDSGDGMPLDKINDILSTTGDLTKEEVDRIDKLNISLPLVHKIIKALNGSLIIKSELKQGTSFLIIVDQKIEEQEKSETVKKIEGYAKNLELNRKILLVSIDKLIIDKVTKSFQKEDISVVNSLYGKDCVNKLNQNEKYELVIIDDELNDESGLDVLNKIKDKTSKPIIIMLSKGKEFIADHYISDGFTDYILKERIEDQIKKINKYL